MKNYSGIARSEIGSSHKKIGKGCQDSSGYYSGAKYCAAIVSDGHGGDKHFRSKTGAELIKEVFEDSIPDFVKSVNKLKSVHDAEEVLRWYEKYLIYAWREEVSSDLMVNPIEDDNTLNMISRIEADAVMRDPHIAYGATMLWGVYCGDYLYLSQLGDGDIRILVKKKIENPIIEDETFKFGRTASLCNKDALSHIRNIILPAEAVNGCFLSTDGVKNSFDGNESFNRFVKTVLNEMADPDNVIKEELMNFLPMLSENGSGDDVSVAAIIRQ